MENLNTVRAMDSTSEQANFKQTDYPALLKRLADMLEDTVGYIALVNRTLNSEEFDQKILSQQVSPFYEELYLVGSFSKEASETLAEARDMVLKNI